VADRPPAARLPAHGIEADQVLATMAELRVDDRDWRGGRVFSLVYSAGDAVHDLLERAATLYSAENALNTSVFPSLGRMQQDIVAISTGLLGGDHLPVAEAGEVRGYLTSGGTEMPKNWNRRFKHNRDKMKTGDIYELAEVVRNLALRDGEKGLSTGEKQMYVKAKKILASELMYAKTMSEDEALEWLEETLTEGAKAKPAPAEKKAAAPKAIAARPTAAAKPAAKSAATAKVTTARKTATAAKKTASAHR